MADSWRGREGHTRFLEAEITHTQTICPERWKPVTLYVIRLSAVGRREVWEVMRRYSKFYDLRVQLQKRFQNDVPPPIPPKRLPFGKEDQRFIEQRRQELEEFLNALLKKPVEISLSEEVCLFFEVPEPLRLCFLETDARAPALLQIPGEPPKAVSIGGGAPDESRVTWLLKQLHDVSNTKVASMRAFEDWILKTKPPLTEANVQLLYLGFELQSGLLEEVGAFQHSEVSSIAALGLLCKLLSHEYCSEAPLFRTVLRRLDLSVLLRMKLPHHIHRNRGHGNRLDAFRVMRSLEMDSQTLMSLLQDDFAFREFRRWQEGLQSSLSFRTLHRASQASPRISNSEPTALLARPALSVQEYRKIALSAFKEVRICLSQFAGPEGDLPMVSVSTATSAHFDGSCHRCETAGTPPSEADDDESLLGTSSRERSSTDPWHHRTMVRSRKRNDSAVTDDSVTPIDRGTETTPELTPPAGPAGAPRRSTSSAPSECFMLEMAPQWRHVPCPEPSWISKYGLQAFYQKAPCEQQSDTYIVRASMRLPFPALSVACLLADHSEFIREALLRKQQQLSQATQDKLKKLADGHYISQLQNAAPMETLKMGMAHEAYSELVECVIGFATAPQANVRLWLLRSIRVLPAAGARSRRETDEQTGSCSESHCESHADEGCGHEPSEAASGSASTPETSPPSYLFVCAAVPPVSALPLDLGAAAEARIGGDAAGSPRPRLVNLKPSGVLIQPTSDGQADVSLCAQLGKDTIRLVSGDLLGERLLFWRSIENLLFILESLCPLHPDFSHSFISHQERCLSADSCDDEVSASPSTVATHEAVPDPPSPENSSASPLSHTVEVELQVDGTAFD